VARQNRRAAVVLHTGMLAEAEMVDACSAAREGGDDDDESDDEATADAPPPPWVASDPGLEPAALKREFMVIVKEQCARVENLLAAHEDDEPDDDPAEQASFDDSAEGERLHRYQNHWSRSLLRTLDAIARLRENTDPDEAPVVHDRDHRVAAAPGERSSDSEMPGRDTGPARERAHQDRTDPGPAPAQNKPTVAAKPNDGGWTYADAERSRKQPRQAAPPRLDSSGSDTGANSRTSRASLHHS
jgi:hypothetical protein